MSEIILIISASLYLSYFGIETSKFNSEIKKQIKNKYDFVDFNFNKIKLLLDLKDFSVKLQTKDIDINIYSNKIKINKCSKKERGTEIIFFPDKKNKFLDSDLIFKASRTFVVAFGIIGFSNTEIFPICSKDKCKILYIFLIFCFLSFQGSSSFMYLLVKKLISITDFI